MYNYISRSVKLAILLVLLLLTVFVQLVEGQVQVSPLATYLSDENPSEEVKFRNASDRPQEVTVELIFGYPDTDETGDIKMKTFKKIPSGAPSAVEWVRIYPRNFTLAPKETQVLRFYARPPQSLPEGEYWARPKVTSRQAEGTNRSEEMGGKVNLVKSVILALNYRNGDVYTRIDIENLKVTSDQNEVRLLTELRRGGNSAYLGYVDIRIYNERGERIFQKENRIAVYRSQLRAFTIPAEKFTSESASYRAEIRFSTEKRENKKGDILPASDVSKSVKFRL